MGAFAPTARFEMHSRYRREKLLGEGGFGRVWKAIDTTTGRIVAIKELRRPDGADLERFEREVRILQRLKGSMCVVGLLDFDLTGENPYLVLEFCELGSLRAWVSQRKTWKHVAGAMSCAAFGLLQIHRENGFHRDIKPDNLLLTTRAEGGLIVKVADFGVARVPVTQRPPMTRSAGGTEGYIAPEVLAGAEFTAAADIYSLGVTTLELLTGSRDASSLMRLPLHVPPRLVELIRSMIDAVPSRRPSVSNVGRTLQDLLRESELVGVAPPRGKVGGSGGFLVMAGLLALAAMFSSDDDE